jgi:hypothetical protein
LLVSGEYDNSKAPCAVDIGSRLPLKSNRSYCYFS